MGYDKSIFGGSTNIAEIEIPSSVTLVRAQTFLNATNLEKIIVRGKSSLSDFEKDQYHDGISGLTTEGGLPEGVTIEFGD